MEPVYITVYSLIFVTSCLYALVLTWIERSDIISYTHNIWVWTSVGVSYILFYVAYLLDLGDWLVVCLAFFVGSIPVISRRLLINLQKNRQLTKYCNGGEEDE